MAQTTFRGTLEHLCLTALIGSTGLTLYGLVTERSTTASMGTAGVAGLLVLWRESTRKDNLQALQNAGVRAQNQISQLQADLESQKAQSAKLAAALNRFRDESGKLYEVSVLLSDRDRLQEMLDTTRSASDQLQVEYQKVLTKAANLQVSWDQLQASHVTLSEELGRVKASSEAEKSTWVRKFDALITEYESQIEALNQRLSHQQRSLDRYQDSNAVILDLERQKLSHETDGLKLKLIELNQFNEALHTHLETGKTVVRELESEFQLLTGSAFDELEGLHQAQLSERDHYVLHLSGQLEKAVAPRTFPGDTEAVRRANKIMSEALKLSEGAIKLHRNDIEPGEVSDAVYFEVEGTLTHTVIDTLNGYGEVLQDALGTCLKPVEFSTDRRLGFVIRCKVVHSRQKAEPKSAIDKLWVPAEQFATKVPKLLKKPVSRIMGSTGEGKGIFANLLLAIEANQLAPIFTRLHDPMDGSSEDYWQISKASKGTSATKKAVKAFVSEFKHRLENGISEPKTLDVFDEIDIVADSDSSINKDFLSCSKGMRHNGMRAYLIGQSPSVGKKFWEWADMDNFNGVYFGTAIVTAIDKTPALKSQASVLKKNYDKLREFCDKQNEDLDLEGGNQYRLGLLVTSGKATFFELPSADSIPCDWSKLTEKSAAIQSSFEGQLTSEPPQIECPECGSVNVRNKGKTKDGNSNYMKCKNCEHNFKVSL